MNLTVALQAPWKCSGVERFVAQMAKAGLLRWQNVLGKKKISNPYYDLALVFMRLQPHSSSTNTFYFLSHRRALVRLKKAHCDLFYR